MEDKKVVVKVHCRIRQDEDDGSYVSHFVGLGLVARGDTEEEAVDGCKHLFSRFVRAYRQSGQLEQRLNQSGSEWYWLEDYPSDEAPPEFVGDNVLSLPTLEEFREAMQRALEQEGDLVGLPMAA